MVKEWRVKKKARKGVNRVFTVTQATFQNPYNAKDVQAYLIDCDDWVNVVATTMAGDIVLIQQFRFGSCRVEIEIPGGIIEHGEDPAIAAARELLEETGFAGEPPELIGRVNPNPALHHHRCYTYWIKNAKKQEEPRFDGPNEKCDLQIEPVASVKRMIESGAIVHGLVIDAIFWYLLRSGKVIA